MRKWREAKASCRAIDCLISEKYTDCSRIRNNLGINNYNISGIRGYLAGYSIKPGIMGALASLVYLLIEKVREAVFNSSIRLNALHTMEDYYLAHGANRNLAMSYAREALDLMLMEYNSTLYALCHLEKALIKNGMNRSDVRSTARDILNRVRESSDQEYSNFLKNLILPSSVELENYLQ